MDVEISRNQKGEFQPQVVKKYQNTVTQDMEEKIISMYAKGMTTACERMARTSTRRSICSCIYGCHPLLYSKGRKNRKMCGIHCDRNLITCVDGLSGFPQAIEAVYLHAEIQQCIIHQIRNSTKYVSYKDLKKLMADLKSVYTAPSESIALSNLEEFGEKWNEKYPKIYKSWKEHWATLSTYFKYPEVVRRLIYTINTIEGFHRQLRKVTKSKSVFPSDDSLLKMLYLAMMDITKKWTGHRKDWGRIYSQLEIYFEERLEGRHY